MTAPASTQTLDASAQLSASLVARFPDSVTADARPGFSGFIVKKENLVQVATALRDEFSFDLLSSVTGVDYIAENKMEVENSWLGNTLPMKSVYHLLEYAVQVLASNKKDRHYNVFKDRGEIRFLDALERKLVRLFPNETKTYLTILSEIKKKKEELTYGKCWMNLK